MSFCSADGWTRVRGEIVFSHNSYGKMKELCSILRLWRKTLNCRFFHSFHSLLQLWILYNQLQIKFLPACPTLSGSRFCFLPSSSSSWFVKNLLFCSPRRDLSKIYSFAVLVVICQKSAFMHCHDLLNFVRALCFIVLSDLFQNFYRRIKVFKKYKFYSLQK